MDIEVAPIANSSASAKPAIPLLGVSIFALPDAYQNGASTALLVEHVTAKHGHRFVFFSQPSAIRHKTASLRRVGRPSGNEQVASIDLYRFAVLIERCRPYSDKASVGT